MEKALVKGKKIDELELEKLLSEYSCNEYRILLPDSMVSTDYKEDRLNITIDIHKIIQDIQVG